MKIDKSISQLLHNHDCVVVPELGGFVANYKSAQIQPIKNTFGAPSKSISFNKNLSKNDGLLANHLVQKYHLNYDDSCKEIENYVASINHNLRLKKRVLIDDVGTLFLDADNRIQFDPENSINYLLDSYGLTTFQKLPIKRVTLEEKITKEVKEKAAPLIAIKRENKNTRKWVATAAAVVALVTVSFWTAQTDFSRNSNFANLNPFKSKVSSTYTERSSTTQFVDVKGSNFKEKLAEATEETTFIDVSFIDGEEPVTVRLKNALTILEPVNTYVETNNIDLRYHIVVGCFSDRSNAEKMVESLKKRGVNAWLIGKRKNLWTVSYSSFLSRKEAVETLVFAKEENPKAWILNQ